MIPIPVFTAQQIENAKAMPKRYTEQCAAACMGVTVAALADWRRHSVGPTYETHVKGTTVYERRHVVDWMYRHMTESRNR